jgi:Zn finger protein HypA/HybF involved in hydrogenase expression
VTPDKARVEVQVGDTYAACPGCSTVYNITTRVCCPSCRCARQNAR